MMGKLVPSVTCLREETHSWPARLFLVAILLSLTLMCGCGDVFRPVATPQLQPGGDPQAAHFAIVVNQNQGAAQGGTTQVDVSGDTNIGNFVVGRGPVHALLLGNLRVWTANPLDDSVSFYAPLSPGGLVSTVSLPAGAHPVYLVATNTQNTYVAMEGRNQVGVLSTGLGALEATINVGAAPVALCETGDASKLYAVNQGSGTVSVISTSDRTVTTSIPVGSNPSACVMKSDSSQVFVANTGSDSISVIDTTTDSVVTTLSLPAGSAPGTNSLSADARLLRVLVADQGANQITIIRADTSTPSVLKNVPVGSKPMSAVALQDGTRIYVANSGDNTVSVIDALGFTLRKAIPVGTDPVYIAASPDSIRVEVANKGSGLGSDPNCVNISIQPAPGTQASANLAAECGSISAITTSNDTVMGAPIVTAGGTTPATFTVIPGSANPVFIAIN